MPRKRRDSSEEPNPTEEGMASEAMYYQLPGEPMMAKDDGVGGGGAGGGHDDDDETAADRLLRSSSDAHARLDAGFLADLWLLVHICVGEHPLAVLVSELTCITALTALALRLLPIPASYTAASSHERADAAV